MSYVLTCYIFANEKHLSQAYSMPGSVPTTLCILFYWFSQPYEIGAFFIPICTRESWSSEKLNDLPCSENWWTYSEFEPVRCQSPYQQAFLLFFFPWQRALPFLQQHFTLYGVHLFWYAVVSLPISFCWTFTCFSLFSFRNNIVMTSFVYIHDCLSRVNYCKWHCWISP